MGVLGLTAIILVVMVSVGPLHRLEDVGQRLEDLGHLTVKATPTLANFADSPDDTNPADQTKALTAEAKAILDGSGPQAMTAAGRRWAVGDVVYVNEGSGSRRCTPKAAATAPPPANPAASNPAAPWPSAASTNAAKPPSCNTPRPALTTSGTRCPSGTYFFYRVK